MSEIINPVEIDDHGLSLKHKVFIPKSSSNTVVFLTHGRAGNHSVMWTFSRVLRELDPLPTIIAPEAFLPDAIGGFSWWPVGQTEDEVKELEKTQLENIYIAAEKLRVFIEEAKEAYAPDAEKVLFFGFSQGGGLGSTLSLLHPELFDVVALLASFIPRKVIDDLGEGYEFNVKPPSYFIAHGTQDKIVPSSRAEIAKDFLESRGASVDMHLDAVGHKVGSAGMSALKSYLSIKW